MYENKVYYLQIDGKIFEWWRRLGTTQGLASDTAIASFLLQQ